ncbi:MAG TPA: alcohol dehydrogenase catalytic domain-containing protein, partial [Acidimicrobiales bacterium]|nr:alcohol dehydrogenase catalytic domain-containing protein [Acidimicrobiales bacterium]
MWAIRFNGVDSSFPAALEEVAEPVLPDGQWARVAVTYGGICGSDLHLFSPASEGSPILASIVVPPFVLGHEIVGTIIEAGADCPWPLGTRVAVDPTLPCLVRGINPPCVNCAKGWTSSCLELDTGVLTPGRSLGFTDGLGGGWAQHVLAHSSMLHAIPDEVSDRASVLHEPISIALHGMGRRPPDPSSAILVVGGGVIGLTTLITLRALFPQSEVTVLVRHPHQIAVARACGAANVVCGSGLEAFEQLAEIMGTRAVGARDHWMLAGGYPYVIEAAGSATALTDSFRAVANRGTVIELGAMGTGRFDMTALWYKEAVLIGSVDHGRDP